MKRRTKILLAIFIIAAVGLYVVNYVIPKTHGLMLKTTVVKYGDLPVSDDAKMVLVRAETLYSAASPGDVKYSASEGEKVRGGVQVVSIGSGTGGSTSSAIDKVMETAGGDMASAGNGRAAASGVVSYYADGYEKKLMPGSISKMDSSLLGSLPKAGTSLKKDSVSQGQPLYKLVDNTMWYMVYWLPMNSNSGADYVKGAGVQVDFGKSAIDAVVHSVKVQGDSIRIVLRSDEYYKDFARQRVAEAQVILAHYQGLIAPLSSIAHRSAGDGVFVKQRSGSYKWIPVKIEQIIKDKCLLTPVSFTDASGTQVASINYYDEILTDPAKDGYK